MSLPPQFCDVETALEEIRAGRMIVVIDDEDRENEGDLTMAAEKITPEAINFMAKYGRGLGVPRHDRRAARLLAPGPMSAENTSNFGTAFTESIDAKDGVTTGISAYDRAQTIKVAIDPSTRPNDLARPGTCLPAARSQGRRAGACRPNRGFGRSRATCGTGSRRRHLRDHERRRHHGARARAKRVLSRAWLEDVDRRRTHSLSHGARALRSPPGRSDGSYRLWRLPHDRLRVGDQRRLAYRAGARRRGKRR